MAHEDWTTDRRRTQEPDTGREVLRRKDQERLEQGRQHHVREVKVRLLGEATGIADLATLEEFVTLGYTADTVQLPQLLPLVMVAWADGTVSSAERDAILEAATARHVGRESRASDLLADHLTHRPSEEIIDRNLRVLRTWMHALPEPQRTDNLHDLTSRCAQVASISRGLFGMGRKVSEGERRVMDRLAPFLRRPALW